MGIFLDGIAVGYFRGVGSEIQYIASFDKINLFVGANNSGKSIILNLISGHLSKALSRPGRISTQELDRHIGKSFGEMFLAVGVGLEKCIDKLAQQIGERGFHPNYTRDQNGEFVTLLGEIGKILAHQSYHGCVWVQLSAAELQLVPEYTIAERSDWIREWDKVWSALTRNSRGSLEEHWVPQTLGYLAQSLTPSLPECHIVPAKRVLGPKGEEFSDLTGRGLIDRLAQLQNPSWNKREETKKFERINEFLRDVTGKSDARLEIPSEREHILVHVDNKVLPLASLGTGIHEVILIAAFCTIYDNSIMCIEEPEVHLHPVLQRKLLSYLSRKTGNQYFIATHSSAFIDVHGVNIFHVSNDGVQTKVVPSITRQAQRSILDDLGARASDILQSNFVIWVEGPSDRIYLNHWIGAVDEGLIEGYHYSIMFYGGALLRHLSASDGAVDEFVSLRALNRNMAIVLDSDKESATSPLKLHVSRIQEELSEGEGLVWITAGREVENYIDGELIQMAMKELHPRIYHSPQATGQYDHSFYFYREDPDRPGRRITYKQGDKVGAAEFICKKDADLSILDLRSRVTELCNRIRQANSP